MVTDQDASAEPGQGVDDPVAHGFAGHNHYIRPARRGTNNGDLAGQASRQRGYLLDFALP
jgi:hypothetical protein